jgi:uncharacterized protein (TIGR03083 family)
MPPALDKARYLELLRADGEALARAASKDLHARVPSCPEWDVSELVRHTGEVHHYRSAIVRRGRSDPPVELEREAGPPDDASLIAWYLEGLDDLVGLLTRSNPETPVWTWGSDQRVAFWIRRMAQETAVHRWDAEAAVSESEPIDVALAVDGVDEMLGEFVPRENLPYGGRRATVALETLDADAGWTVRLEPELVPTYASSPSAARNVTIRGGASDLLLLLWRRVGRDAVEVEGDLDAAADLWAYLEGPGQ